MKTMKGKASMLIIVLSLLVSACGLSVKSDSSCKSTLCKGFWSYEYNAEPMITKNGNFIFKKDGSCQYCVIDKQTNGVWSLGEVTEVTSKISYRIVNVTMDNDINMGTGKNFQMKLYAGNKKNTVDLGSATYYHFDDNSKPIK